MMSIVYLQTNKNLRDPYQCPSGHNLVQLGIFIIYLALYEQQHWPRRPPCNTVKIKHGSKFKFLPITAITPHFDIILDIFVHNVYVNTPPKFALVVDWPTIWSLWNAFLAINITIYDYQYPIYYQKIVLVIFTRHLSHHNNVDTIRRHRLLQTVIYPQ